MRYIIIVCLLCLVSCKPEDKCEQKIDTFLSSGPAQTFGRLLFLEGETIDFTLNTWSEKNEHTGEVKLFFGLNDVAEFRITLDASEVDNIITLIKNVKDDTLLSESVIDNDSLCIQEKKIVTHNYLKSLSLPYIGNLRILSSRFEKENNIVLSHPAFTEEGAVLMFRGSDMLVFKEYLQQLRN